MGADGGVSWIPLRDVSKLKRVKELLAPFECFTYIDDYHWSNVEWISDNSDFLSDCIYGTYGISQDHSLHDTLAPILSTEDQDLCDDPSLTFGELVEDLLTRPLIEISSGKIIYLNKCGTQRLWDLIDAKGKYLTMLECLVCNTVQYFSEDFAKDDFGSLYEKNILDWINELRMLLDYEKSASAET